ncbi:MAG TPA: hypothetical protein VGU24_02455 [Microvirga sp.]|nr:hypothetical protein [Microvirga sp.]
MRRLVFIVSLLGIVASGPALARDTRPSLCTGQEVTVFSCSIGAKVVSLCATPDLAEETGRLTYRFGRKGAVELTYPEAEGPAKNHFIYSTVGAAGGDFVRFSRGGTTYTVEFSDGPRLRHFAGVTVHRGAKRIAEMRCRERWPLGERGYTPLYPAKLPGGLYEIEDEASPLPDDLRPAPQCAPGEGS